MSTTEINGMKLTQMVEEDAYGSPEVPLAYAKELDELDENLIKVFKNYSSKNFNYTGGLAISSYKFFVSRSDKWVDINFVIP